MKFHIQSQSHLTTPNSKQLLNRALFTEVAPKYDFITKALSLGQDIHWKQNLINSLPIWRVPVCLDIACGTGDLTRLLACRYPGGQISGIDLTPDMLDIARARSLDKSIVYTECSMQSLPFEDGSVDILTGGYALRNAPDLNRTIDEIHRVLRKGGTAAFLDFSKPTSRLGQHLGHLVLKIWGGFWGLLLHANSDVYGYIADSLALFPDREELRVRFRDRGFTLRFSRQFYGGLLECLIFNKKGG